MMKFFEWASFLLASIVPGIDQPAFDSGVTIHIPENSSLIAEEQVEIRVGDKFAAAILDPVSGEIFSQSEWIEVTK
jgi:hypothetical protein